MQVTKNDLSYDQTKLDYQAMLTTAEVAFARSRAVIYGHLRELDKYPLTSCFYLNTEYLEREAKYLNIVAETLYTLREGLTRHELEVVNKPEVKENPMTQITLQVDLTQVAASRVAKTLRHLAYQQRYPNDEQDLTLCAKVFEGIAVALFDLEPKEEPCPICGKPSPAGYPHQECLVRGGALNPDTAGVNEDGKDLYAQVKAEDYGSGGDED